MDNVCCSNVLDTQNTGLTNTDITETEDISSFSGFFEEYIPTKCVYCMISSAEQQDMKLYLERQKIRLHRFNLHNYLLKIKFAKQQAKEQNQNTQLLQLESESQKIGEDIYELENKLNEKYSVVGISNNILNSLSPELTSTTLTCTNAGKDQLLNLQTTTSFPAINDVPVTENMNPSSNIAHRLRLLIQAANKEARN